MLPPNERGSVRLLGRRPTRVHEETGDAQYAREQARMAAKRAIQEQTQERMIEAFFPDTQQRRMEWLEVARLARELETARQQLDKAELASRVALETCCAGAPTPVLNDCEAAAALARGGSSTPVSTLASARPGALEVPMAAPARVHVGFADDTSSVCTPMSARTSGLLLEGGAVSPTLAREARAAVQTVPASARVAHFPAQTPTTARVSSFTQTSPSVRAPSEPAQIPTSARAAPFAAHPPTSARASASSLSLPASSRGAPCVISTPTRSPGSARPSSAAVAAAESNLRAVAARRKAEVESEFRDRWEERRTALEERTWFYRGAHEERWRAPDRRTPVPRLPPDARAGGPSIIAWAPTLVETPRRRPATATRERDEGANARDAMHWEIPDAPRRSAR